MPPESIRRSLDNSRSPAEEELMQSVEDSIVESAEVIGYNLLLQMSIGAAIPLLSQSLMEEDQNFVIYSFHFLLSASQE